MLDRTDADRLAELLEACAALLDVDRWEPLIARLPMEIRLRLVRTRPGAVRLFVLNLVDTCNLYVGGLGGLVEAVRHVEGDTAQMQAVDDFLAER
ncbi:effector-associated domain 2-containing protein [Haliangium sp.]|uniref:effector-associated domain 2-containing protein n=1 Tax=Haliangium sp. TaxID=2663208 RepID=UPI003D0E28F1